MAADPFAGFTEGHVEGERERLFCRAGGPETAPAVVLLHGYPQTHMMWHAVAPALAERFRVVLFDLPGYGRSSVPPDAPDHAPYSKRRMAHEVAAATARLGHRRFRLVGHDRGARVAYRLALDLPERIERVAVLDIVPTGALWRDFTPERGLRFYHWLFLAQPAPLPEMLIGSNPVAFLDRTIAGWTKRRDLSAFAPAALDDYHRFFSDPARLHATCEDYRAGAGIDRIHDEETMARGGTIAAPLLVLYGDTNFAGQNASPLDVWRDWAADVSGAAVDSGHFIPEENPAATLRHLSAFLSAGRT